MGTKKEKLFLYSMSCDWSQHTRFCSFCLCSLLPLIWIRNLQCAGSKYVSRRRAPARSVRRMFNLEGATNFFRHGRVAIATRGVLFWRCRWSSCVTSRQSASVFILMHSIRALNQDRRLLHPASSGFYPVRLGVAAAVSMSTAEGLCGHVHSSAASPCC